MVEPLHAARLEFLPPWACFCLPHWATGSAPHPTPPGISHPHKGCRWQLDRNGTLHTAFWRRRPLRAHLQHCLLSSRARTTRRCSSGQALHVQGELCGRRIRCQSTLLPSNPKYRAIGEDNYVALSEPRAPELNGHKNGQALEFKNGILAFACIDDTQGFVSYELTWFPLSSMRTPPNPAGCCARVPPRDMHLRRRASSAAY